MSNENLVCPNCHSENIQRFEIAYHSGVSTSSHTTVGVGYSGGGFGVGTAETTGVSVSNLSQSVAPPEKKGYIKSLIIGLIASSIVQVICEAVIGKTFGGIMSLVAFAGAIYWIYKTVYCWNRDVYPKLLDEWYHSWICLKCGHRFILD